MSHTKSYRVTKKEILKKRDKKYPDSYTQEISGNIDRLLVPINAVRDAYDKPMSVSSGWRPPAINEATSNAAEKSNHLKGLAVDFKDPNGKLRDWVLDNLAFIASLGIYLEDFRWTPGWVHMQIVPPGSKRRIYRPSMADARDPNAWDGKYDKSLNG